jgi:hypothetical protein
MSNKLSGCDGDGGGELAGASLFFPIVSDANDISGELDRTAGGAGARCNTGGGILAGCLPGVGSGELRDCNDFLSNCRSRSIASFFLRCSWTNDETETSSFDGLGTVREILAAVYSSISRTFSRSRSFASAA